MNKLIENASSKMTAVSLFGLLVLSLFSLSMHQDVQGQFESGIKTYTLAKYGVIFQYPQDWNVEVVSGDEVDFDWPEGSVSLVVANATGYESTRKVTDELVAYYKAIFAGFRIAESADLMFAGYPGHRLIVIVSQGETEVKMMQVYSIYENKLYSITYAASTENYSANLPSVNNMIGSFKIDPSIMPVRVSGAYANPEFGLEIDFPNGWNGVQTRNENGTNVVLIPDDGRKLSIVLTTFNASDFFGGKSQDPLKECNTSTVRYDELSGISSILYEGECDGAKGFFIMKGRMYALEDRLLIAMLLAPSRTAFKSGVEEFDQSIQTLSLKNNVNVFNNLMYSYMKNGNKVAGEYVNPRAGISMQLPEGWVGFEKVTDTTSSVILLPPLTEKRAAMIGIDVMDMSSYHSEYESEFLGSIQYVALDGRSALGLEGEVEVQNLTLKTKGYTLAAGNRVITIAYVVPTSLGDSPFLSEFEQSVKSLTIRDSADLTKYISFSVDFKKSEQTVIFDEKPYQVKVASTSNVTGIVLNEEKKQLALDLEEVGLGNGTSFVAVSAVLEGPFIVTVDGAPTEFAILNSTESSQTTIAVNHPRDTQSIVVAGTRVVPEFPFAMVGVVGIIVALAIASTRYRLPPHSK